MSLSLIYITPLVIIVLYHVYTIYIFNDFFYLHSNVIIDFHSIDQEMYILKYQNAKYL